MGFRATNVHRCQPFRVVRPRFGVGWWSGNGRRCQCAFPRSGKRRRFQIFPTIPGGSDTSLTRQAGRFGHRRVDLGDRQTERGCLGGSGLGAGPGLYGWQACGAPIAHRRE
ncbi:hypothetical protein HMPREF0591_0300 [Mycobacterium parascrofulaceum ATCC BAA-614]|uniref:Uncharacterized protein n=1 Tax=Mycobacterium parascrofulaceum ATCC BAA-614 TaxID=525368 RepID=D5P2A6_9MYCO|nr:hypothetical protein HMPREF0591_0300 [Mycobacterium parascrofulaceum ATCC BAA-614]